jgi:hypothetical protein
MKNNVIVISEDRNLFGTKIRQQTQKGLLNLSDLQEAYTVSRVKNGWVEKNVTMILTNPHNVDTLFYLLEKQNVIKLSHNSFIENIEKQGFAKYMKTLGVYKTTGARETRTVWVNPYIFVMVAMDLNPIFKAEVIGWLTDSLIINRIEAGNFYKELSKAITRFKSTDYVAIAKGLNWIIFNKHETGLRNTATAKELEELKMLENKLAFAIDSGFIKTQDELLLHMRKMWKEKWSNK